MDGNALLLRNRFVVGTTLAGALFCLLGCNDAGTGKSSPTVVEPTESIAQQNGKRGEAAPAKTSHFAAAEQPALPETPYPSAHTIQALQQEALEVAQRLTSILPESSDAMAVMARVHERQGNSTEAVDCWQRALELNPNRADAYQGIGWVALQKEDYIAAVVALAKSLQINPRVPDVHNDLAGALINLGRLEEAIATLEQAVKIFPAASQSHFMLGQVYLQSKE